MNSIYCLDGEFFVPLCVPFDEKHIVKALGARWIKDERVWVINASLVKRGTPPNLIPYIPRMYRSDIEGPYIRPIMVPQSVWGKNLRSLIPEDDWKRIKKSAYKQAGYRCRICGGVGEQWPVEADELWKYDDATRNQKLVNVLALCPTCHKVHHFGRTRVDGLDVPALKHMMFVNGWAWEQAVTAVEDAFELWHQRSQHSWTVDHSWAEKKFGVVVTQEGLGRAEQSNRELVEEARRGSIDHLFGGLADL